MNMEAERRLPGWVVGGRVEVGTTKTLKAPREHQELFRYEWGIGRGGLLRLYAVSYGPEGLGLRRGVVFGVTGKAVFLGLEGGGMVGLVDSGGVDGPVTVRVRGLGGAVGALGG